MRNPYEVLGVQANASFEEIKAAYRRRAKETHPDLHGGSHEYTSRFCEVTDAYAILSDPVARSRFDQTSTVDKERTAAAAQEIYEVIAYIRSRAAEAKSAAMSSALRGLAWLGGGSLISLLGYASAVSSGGGRYPIFWGAILFGGIQAYRGFVAYANINAKARELEQNVWNLVTDKPIA